MIHYVDVRLCVETLFYLSLSLFLSPFDDWLHVVAGEGKKQVESISEEGNIKKISFFFFLCLGFAFMEL